MLHTVVQSINRKKYSMIIGSLFLSLPVITFYRPPGDRPHSCSHSIAATKQLRAGRRAFVQPSGDGAWRFVGAERWPSAPYYRQDERVISCSQGHAGGAAAGASSVEWDTAELPIFGDAVWSVAWSPTDGACGLACGGDTAAVWKEVLDGSWRNITDQAGATLPEQS